MKVADALTVIDEALNEYQERIGHFEREHDNEHRQKVEDECYCIDIAFAAIKKAVNDDEKESVK